MNSLLSRLSSGINALIRLRFPFRRTVVLICFQLGLTLFEALSVTLLLPLLNAVQLGDEPNNSMAENSALQHIHSGLNFVGITPNLTNLAIAIFGCVLIRQLFQALFHYFNSYTSNYYIRDLRVALFDSVLRSRTTYLLKVTTGEIVNDIVTEIERASAALFSVVSFIGMAMLFCAYVVTTIAISSWTVVLAFGLIGIFFLALRRILKKSFETGDAVAVLNRRVSAFLFERIRMVRLIRLTGSAEAEGAVLEGLVTNLHTQRLKISKLGAVIPLLIQPLAFAFILFFLVIGSSNLNLEFTVILVLIGILVRLLPIVQELAMRSQAFLGSYGSVKRVHGRLVELDAVAEVDEGAEHDVSLKDGIRFEDVTFHYLTDDVGPPALMDVTFEIDAGSFTALVGPSGAGKSTLVDLLARLHEPSGGCIFLDGVPLDQYTLSGVRAAIAFVSQTPLLLNTPISEHIAYGDDDASDEAVRSAAKLAGADEFIMSLPDGYETRLDEDGVRLSGGQRQRIEIARALFRKAPILILDEPSTGLDVQSERLLHSTIERINRELNTTVIVISHELSSISNADRIIVMNAGRVIEIGTHDSLLRQSSWYADAFEKSNSGFQDGTSVLTAD